VASRTDKHRDKVNASHSTRVVVSIRAGSGTPAMQIAWRRFWQHLLSEACTERESATDEHGERLARGLTDKGSGHHAPLEATEK